MIVSDVAPDLVGDLGNQFVPVYSALATAYIALLLAAVSPVAS